MSEKVAKTYSDFTLPANVVSKIDIAHLVREAERLDGELTTVSTRAQAGVSDDTTLSVSERFTQFLQVNQLQFKDSRERSEVIRQLRLLKDKAPVIHMTFATEADPESLGQLALWLRQSVHPQAVIATGLQPALVAGVYLRTPNHVHDLSLRAKLQGSRDLLIKELSK